MNLCYDCLDIILVSQQHKENLKNEETNEKNLPGNQSFISDFKFLWLLELFSKLLL